MSCNMMILALGVVGIHGDAVNSSLPMSMPRGLDQLLNLTGSCGSLACIPGFDKFVIGFDAVTGDIPRQPAHLLNFSFAEQRTYTNPFDQSLKWGIPDQINVIDDTHAEVSVSTSTYHSTSSYTDDLSVDANIDTQIGWFGASLAAKYARSVLEDTDDYGAFSSSSLNVNLYDMTFDPDSATLSSSARAFLADLPSNFTASDYLPFVHRFGTHFISSAHLGGRGHMTSAVNKKFSSSVHDTKISAQASVHFSFVKAGGSAQSHVHDASSDFTSESSFQTSLLGGDVTLGLEEWSKWIKTFYSAPGLIKYNLMDVTSLLPNTKDGKRDNVRLGLNAAKTSPPPTDPLFARRQL